MTAVVVEGQTGKEYRLPTVAELDAARVERSEIEALYPASRSACRTSPSWRSGRPPIREERPVCRATGSTRGARSSRTGSFWRSERSSRRSAAASRQCATTPTSGVRRSPPGWRLRSVDWRIAAARWPPGRTTRTRFVIFSPVLPCRWSGTSRSRVPWPTPPAASFRPSSGSPGWSSTRKRPPPRRPLPAWSNGRRPRRGRTVSTSCARIRPTTTPSPTPT